MVVNQNLVETDLALSLVRSMVLRLIPQHEATVDADPQAIRLDYFLAEHALRLTVDVRLNLIQQIAEAIKYCQDKRVIHRALSPLSILVNSEKPDSPCIDGLYGWRSRATWLRNMAGGLKLRVADTGREQPSRSTSHYREQSLVLASLDLGEGGYFLS